MKGMDMKTFDTTDTVASFLASAVLDCPYLDTLRGLARRVDDPLADVVESLASPSWLSTYTFTWLKTYKPGQYFLLDDKLLCVLACVDMYLYVLIPIKGPLSGNRMKAPVTVEGDITADEISTMSSYDWTLVEDPWEEL